MSNAHGWIGDMEFWRSEATEMLSQLDPAVESLPIYVIPRAEVGIGGPDAACCAFTGSGLDVALQPDLERLGEWRGRGFATVMDIGRIRVAGDEQAGPSYVESVTRHFAIHEFAHFLSDGGASELGALHPVVATALQKAAAGEIDLPGAPSKASAPSKTSVPPWHLHDTKFIRTACHLAHRANAVGFPVNVELCNVGGPQYGLSPATDYRDALGDELEQRQQERLTGILGTPPPQAFQQLFDADSAKWDATHGTHEQAPPPLSTGQTDDS